MRKPMTLVLVAVVLAACTAQQQGGTPQAPLPTVAPVAVETPTPAVLPAQPAKFPSTYVAISTRTWALITKDPDKYAGRGYKVWACITQFDAATGPTVFRAQASSQDEQYWYVGGAVNALFQGEESKLADFVQGDVVSMSVVSQGSFSYDTQIGGNTTAPVYWVVSIKRASGSC